MQPREMTDSEIRAELATLDKTSDRYQDLMTELEERVLLRRSDWGPPRGWHSAMDELG